MVNVLYDFQAFERQRFGGVSRYFSAILNCFMHSGEVNVQLPISRFENDYLRAIPTFSHLPRKTLADVQKKVPAIRKLFSAIEYVDPKSNRNRALKSLQSQQYDIFHPTYFDPYFIKPVAKKPVVITVHDMIHELMPDLLPNDRKTAAFKKVSIARADLIITVSQNTRKDLMDIYGIQGEKISVAHLANSLSPHKVQPSSLTGLPANYILYVGSRATYKNFTGLLDAVAPLLQTDKSLYLVVAGGYFGVSAFSPQEEKLLSGYNIRAQVVDYKIDDQRLAFLYANARCFVFPSLYEGFGIPVVEAFACSCPCVISNTSSLPEVGGEAVLYFDPRDPSQMRNEIQKVIYNDELRERMTRQGLIQLQKFSWEDTAEKTATVYRSLVK